MEEKAAEQKPVSYKILGISLVVLSFGCWALIPLIWFFDSLSHSFAVFLDVAILVIAEIMFWLGSIIIGRELALKIRKVPSPVFLIHKKEKDEKEEAVKGKS